MKRKKGPSGQKKRPETVSSFRVSGYTLNPTLRSTAPRKDGSTNSKGK
jgi:hypothetical protein